MTYVVCVLCLGRGHWVHSCSLGLQFEVALQVIVRKADGRLQSQLLRRPSDVTSVEHNVLRSDD